ncbi:hypothetical protein [Paenibacillus sp.]|uniref:hypothetical protein n=1 Tax=Paenibacillus sp. TaxID=58172 RepID=UPI002811BD45|nr:hypothetical protein [Paenibacillus sp.]
MRTKLVIDNVALSDHNEELGLYQFIVTFTDRSKARVFMRRDPEWKVSSVNRLLNIPCTICRKDYYCKCFEKHAPDIENQLVEGEYIPEALASKAQ